MSRVLSAQLKDEVGKKVELLGRLYSLRELSSELAFLNIQDRSGIVQFVFEGKKVDAKVGSIVKVTGTVKEEKRAALGVEVMGETLEVL